jgi:hypothetical protein
MVAPVAVDMDSPDDPVALKLLEAGGDVGAGEAKLFDNIVGGKGALGQIEEGVDLRHRAVDTPLRAHLAPVEDEGLGIGVVDHAHGRSFL